MKFEKNIFQPTNRCIQNYILSVHSFPIHCSVYFGEVCVVLSFHKSVSILVAYWSITNCLRTRCPKIQITIFVRLLWIENLGRDLPGSWVSTRMAGLFYLLPRQLIHSHIWQLVALGFYIPTWCLIFQDLSTCLRFSSALVTALLDFLASSWIPPESLLRQLDGHKLS
jgi:hypothetical protein